MNISIINFKRQVTNSSQEHSAISMSIRAIQRNFVIVAISCQSSKHCHIYCYSATCVMKFWYVTLSEISISIYCITYLEITFIFHKSATFLPRVKDISYSWLAQFCSITIHLIEKGNRNFRWIQVPCKSHMQYI